MRRKRKKKKRHSIKKRNCIIYTFTNLQIKSIVPLSEEQLVKVHVELDEIINSSIDEPKYIVAKHIIVQMEPIICAVQYNTENLCFFVTVNEKYLD